jgi:hypothetical protein
MNKRHSISEMYAKGITKFVNASSYECLLVACISEPESEKICNDYGINFTYAENKTTGYKFNNALKFALTFDWDYLMVMGDDDIIDADAWQLINPLIENLNHYFGFDRIYFHHLPTNDSMKYIIEEPHGGVIGCGRFIHRSVIDKTGLLWLDEQETGCDYISGKKIREAGYERTLIKECCMVDIKTDMNIWNFSQYKKKRIELSETEKEYVRSLITF